MRHCECGANLTATTHESSRRYRRRRHHAGADVDRQYNVADTYPQAVEPSTTHNSNRQPVALHQVINNEAPSPPSYYGTSTQTQYGNPLPTVAVTHGHRQHSTTSILRHYGFVTSSSNILGVGHYSKVYYATLNEHKYAVKCIKLKSVGPDLRTRFLPREIKCWKKANHRNICMLYNQFSYQDDYLFLVMEYCNRGDLLTRLQKQGALPYEHGRAWMSQLLSAITYLHQTHRIAHRDIKAENVLIDEHNSVKLTDFGFACISVTSTSNTYCGSRAYSPPEVLCGSPYNVFKADIWSFGALIYVAMTNSMPFIEKGGGSDNSKIIEQQRNRTYTWPSKTASGLRTTVDLMLTFEETYRPSLAQVWCLPFFSNHTQENQ